MKVGKISTAMTTSKAMTDLGIRRRASAKKNGTCVNVSPMLPKATIM